MYLRLLAVFAVLAPFHAAAAPIVLTADDPLSSLPAISDDGSTIALSFRDQLPVGTQLGVRFAKVGAITKGGEPVVGPTDSIIVDFVGNDPHALELANQRLSRGQFRRLLWSPVAEAGATVTVDGVMFAVKVAKTKLSVIATNDGKTVGTGSITAPGGVAVAQGIAIVRGTASYAYVAVGFPHQAGNTAEPNKPARGWDQGELATHWLVVKLSLPPPDSKVPR